MNDIPRLALLLLKICLPRKLHNCGDLKAIGMLLGYIIGLSPHI